MSDAGCQNVELVEAWGRWFEVEVKSLLLEAGSRTVESMEAGGR